MSTTLACPHCGGTTLCGDSECSHCSVKSGLPPMGSSQQVVCSFCGGTGTALLKEPTSSRRFSQTKWVLLASPLLLLAGVLTAVAIKHWHEREFESEHMRETIERAAIENTRRLPLAQIKSQVMGVTWVELKIRLGEPESRRQLPSNDGDGKLEVCTYQCKEGRLKITLRDGKVKDVSED